MSTKSQPNNAALQSDNILNAYLALTRIYFASTERLTLLAMETAQSSLEDSVAATRLTVAMGENANPKIWQTSLGQPAVERVRALTNSTYEILAEAQAQVLQVLGSQMAFPAMRFPLSEDWTSVFERFSQGMRDFSAMSAASVAAATENVSEITARADRLIKKAA